MHPLKAGGGGQARVDGDDFLEGGLKGVDLLNARQQRLRVGGAVTLFIKPPKDEVEDAGKCGQRIGDRPARNQRKQGDEEEEHREQQQGTLPPAQIDQGLFLHVLHQKTSNRTKADVTASLYVIVVLYHK